MVCHLLWARPLLLVCGGLPPPVRRQQHIDRFDPVSDQLMVDHATKHVHVGPIRTSTVAADGGIRPRTDGITKIV